MNNDPMRPFGLPASFSMDRIEAFRDEFKDVLNWHNTKGAFEGNQRQLCFLRDYGQDFVHIADGLLNAIKAYDSAVVSVPKHGKLPKEIKKAMKTYREASGDRAFGGMYSPDEFVIIDCNFRKAKKALKDAIMVYIDALNNQPVPVPTDGDGTQMDRDNREAYERSVAANDDEIRAKMQRDRTAMIERQEAGAGQGIVKPSTTEKEVRYPSAIAWQIHSGQWEISIPDGTSDWVTRMMKMNNARKLYDE